MFVEILLVLLGYWDEKKRSSFTAGNFKKS